MTDNPLVSVIVPVYNVKDYLPQCLDSLLAINYPSKEIIIVEDCSTDGSIKICSEYKEKYPELTLIQHKQNKGVQEARITGVSNANGEYVMFVDSDDFVDTDILNHLVSNALLYEADLVCAQSYIRVGNSNIIDKRSVYGIYHRDDIERLFHNNLIMDESLYRSGMPMYLWGKLFKKEYVIESLRKGLGLKYGEDEVSVVDYLMNYTQTLVSIGIPLYYYRQHPLQITAKTVVELWPDFIKQWERLETLDVWSWNMVLPRRMWCFVKPSIYANSSYKNMRKFIYAMKQFRKSKIVTKYIFDNNNLSSNIKKHPHYFLLKYRFYLIDYIMYTIIWSLPKK